MPYAIRNGKKPNGEILMWEIVESIVEADQIKRRDGRDYFYVRSQEKNLICRLLQDELTSIARVS